MRTQTIINRLKKQAESYGCIPEMSNAIQQFFAPIAEYPRCSVCGRPYQVQDMANDDEIFVGCPNIAHKDDDMRIRAYQETR